MTRRRIALLLLLPGWLFLIAGFGIAAGGFYTLTREIAFALRADATLGVVESVRTVERSRGTVHVATLRFATAAGETIHTESRHANGWARHAPGDMVSVRYDPAAPDRAAIDHLALRLLGPLIALPIGGILIALGWPLVAPPYGRQQGPILLLSGAASTLVLLLAASVAANEINAARARLRATALAQGEVIGHRTMTREDGTSGAIQLHAPLIRFVTAGGQAVVADPPRWTRAPDPAPGTSVPMRYRLDDPARAEPHSAWAIWLRPAIAMGVLLVLVGLGAALLARRFRPVYLPRRA